MFVFLKRHHISRKKCIHSVMANTFPTWYQLTGLREDFKSYLLVSVSRSNPKAKQVFAFSTIDTQALCKCFHKANYPLQIPLGTFLLVTNLQVSTTPVCKGLYHMGRTHESCHLLEEDAQGFHLENVAPLLSTLGSSCRHSPSTHYSSYCSHWKAKIKEQTQNRASIFQ